MRRILRPPRDSVLLLGSASLLLAVLIACGEQPASTPRSSASPSPAGAEPVPSPAGAKPARAAATGANAATPAPAPEPAAPSESPAETTSATAKAAPEAGRGVRGTASIEGAVRFTGSAPPEMARIDMSADENCEALHEEPVTLETVVVNANGTLRNVFVYVREGIEGEWPAPPEPVQLTQQGCAFHPHVFGIQVGQELLVVNEDETLHNVHAIPDINEGFNFGQPKKGDEASKSFDYEEVMIPFQCDVHNWMSAWAGVLPHPFYAVTGNDGSFSIAGLPAGTYTLVAWHEKYGEREQTVTLGDGEAKTIEFAMGS